ncbi:MAG: hypothetical protein ACYSX0_19740 [Planctomycetota bacterium]|jgi:tetratricopeptide (TPR) repeat protein
MLIVGWRMGSGIEEVDGVYAEGLGLAEALGDAVARARLIDGHATVQSFRDGDMDEAARRTREAFEIAEEASDRGLQVALHQRLAFFLDGAGRLEEALAIAEQGLERAGGDVQLGVEVMGWSPYLFLRCLRGGMLVQLGRLAEGEAELVLTRELIHAEGDRDCIFINARVRQMLASWQGDFESALRCAREQVEVSERMGSPLFALMSRMMLATALLDTFQCQTAREIAKELWPFGQHLVMMRPVLQEIRARAALGLGDLAGARSAAIDALDSATRVPAVRVGVGVFVRLQATQALLASDGDASTERVARELDTVQGLIEETGAEVLRPRLHERRAQLAAVRGPDDIRVRELREAHRLYVEMGATGHADRVAQELGA